MTHSGSRPKGCVYIHIPRTFIIAMFRQFLKVAKFPDVRNKAPYERLITMSRLPSFPLKTALLRLGVDCLVILD